MTDANVEATGQDVVKAIRDNTTLGPIYAYAPDAILAAAWAELEEPHRTVLAMNFGVGRPKAKAAEIRQADPGLTDVRTAVQEAGRRLTELLETLLVAEFKARPDQLSHFKLSIRALLRDAGIFEIPDSGTFTQAQSEALFNTGRWRVAQTRDFNAAMAAQEDKRTMADLVHPEVRGYSFVESRIRG